MLLFLQMCGRILLVLRSLVQAFEERGGTSWQQLGVADVITSINTCLGHYSGESAVQAAGRSLLSSLSSGVALVPSSSNDILVGGSRQAADLPQEALTRNLEMDSDDERDGVESIRKGRKKKSMTRSPSFAAEQPDEKSQKLDDSAGVRVDKDHPQQLEGQLTQRQVGGSV